VLPQVKAAGLVQAFDLLLKSNTTACPNAENRKKTAISANNHWCPGKIAKGA
jgi:hypothetical protein